MPANRRQKTGFTLIELLVVISIIALLISLLLPALTMTKDRVKTLMCANKMRAWGLGFALYADDYNRWLHFGFAWPEHWVGIYPDNGYVGGGMGHEEANTDPVFEGRGYDWVQYGIPAQLFIFCLQPESFRYYKYDQLIPTAFILTDTGIGAGQNGAFGYSEDRRHSGQSNFLFPDAHVDLLAPQIGVRLPIRDQIKGWVW